MKKQHLVVLAAALVLLALVRFLVDRGPGTATSLEEAGLTRVLGSELEPADITAIRVSGPGEGARLELARAGEGWTVTSAHGAPGRADDIDDFLESLSRLRGEVRGEGEALFAEFGVDEASAARVELLAGDEPRAVLLVGGEGDDFRSHFLRAEGSGRIHHLVDGIAAALGLPGASRAPKSDHWVELQLLDVAASQVIRVAAQRPDQDWLLEKTATAEGEEAAWRVSRPATGLPADAVGIQSFVDRVARLRAASVLDPASPACADASFDRSLVLSAGRDHRVELGSVPAEDGTLAARVDGGATCWALQSWTAESLMPRASQLLELDDPLGDPAPESAEFTRLELTRGDRIIRLEREGEDWRLVRPERAPADRARVDRMLSALRFLSWEDLAVEAGRSEAELAGHARLTARGGERSWTLRLLGERATSADGDRYARLEGSALPDGQLAVVGGSAVESLTPSLEELRASAPNAGP